MFNNGEKESGLWASKKEVEKSKKKEEEEEKQEQQKQLQQGRRKRPAPGRDKGQRSGRANHCDLPVDDDAGRCKPELDGTPTRLSTRREGSRRAEQRKSERQKKA